ncbi:MAG: hypothetical protein IIB61_09425 [Planctomycetes bacterium]|nr:hypothetical protein [Planctomycetota bacterium]
MTGHHEWDCKFIKMDLVPYAEELQGVTHTGMKCDVCGITFEMWVTVSIVTIVSPATPAVLAVRMHRSPPQVAAALVPLLQAIQQKQLVG